MCHPLHARVCMNCAGGGVQPAVCAPRAPVQEAVRGPLPGLCPERQRRAGRLCGAGAAQDGGPDAGLRPVHISKSPDRWRDELEALCFFLQTERKLQYFYVNRPNKYWFICDFNTKV